MSDSDRDTPSRSGPRSGRRRLATDDADDAGGSSPRPDKKRVKLEQNAAQARKKQRTVADEDSDADMQDQHDRNGAADGDEDDENMGPDGEDEDLEDDEDERKQILTRGDDGYVTGSITRIACHSFLTYDSVEFRPGPALNMIIGPNGTGKSTIACAIAIGLGFPAKVLGRSTKLSAYCKNDSTEETWIEIELKGRPGENNLTVRRYLSRDSEKSKFELDGEEVAATEVMVRMQELQVQVANLCTFLPQDRVAAFAMMSASERLRETQSAAGHRNLNAWHNLLIEEGKKCKSIQTEYDRHAEKLKRAETKQAEAEKEVRAFEQREKLEKEKQIVDVLVAFAEYHATFDAYNLAKQEKTTVKNEILELEERYRPFKQSKAALARIVEVSKKEQNTVDKKVSQALKDAEQKKASLAKAENDRDKVHDQLQAVKQDEKRRKQQLAETKDQIRKLEPFVQNEPPEVSTSAIDTQMREKGHMQNDVKQQANSLRAERDQLEHRAESYKRREDTAHQELHRSRQTAQVREKNLKDFDMGTWRAVVWLRENANRFRGKVYEPARLNVFVKKEWNGRRIENDRELVNMIEGPIALKNFNTFLFEYQEDYDLMFRLLVDEAERNQSGTGARISGSVIDRNWRLDNMPRTLDQQQLERLGFDAMAIDFLDGPEAVLCYLADEAGLSKTPIQVNRRPLAAAEIEKMRVLQRWYDRDGSHSIRYSNYGNRYAQQDFRSLQASKILHLTVNQGQVDQIQARIQEAQQERIRLKELWDSKQAEERELLAQYQQLDEERKELLGQKQELEKARRQWLKASLKLDQLKKAFDKLNRLPSMAERQEALKADLRKIMEKRVRYAVDYKNHVMRAADLLEGSIKINLQSLQAENDKREMDLMVQERDEEIEAKRAELVQIEIKTKELFARGKEQRDLATELINTVDDETRNRIEERREESETQLQALQDERVEIETNLDCMQAVSPAVLEAYNARKKEIASIKKKYEDSEARLTESKEIIDTTERRWLPKLERLVQEVSEKFSAYFDTLGLLGEVRIAKDDDYEKWGIGIWVRFRDPKDKSGDVELHELSGHRQSGGERALTTVTYLLALAELARAPFALVDEINQGMDQRAERNMHKMLVETTCSHDVGQYFLLTPKLLPDLVYHPKMKVLVINVSPWIPADLSLEQIIAKKRKLLRCEQA